MSSLVQQSLIYSFSGADSISGHAKILHNDAWIELNLQATEAVLQICYEWNKCPTLLNLSSHAAHFLFPNVK